MSDYDCSSEPPAEESIRVLLEVISPGSVLLSVGSLPGSYSNYTHLVQARSDDGSDLSIVIRRYAIYGDYDRGEKAHREFRTLELLQRNGIPVPEPLYLDEEGVMLRTPGIVTSYVPGEQVASPSDPMSWARSLAMMLARIHLVPCDSVAKGFLLDANSEASWFLRSGSVPDYMKDHPNGAMVWQMVHDLWPNIRQAPAGLVHIDYWSGNILWAGGEIAAVVDWEEAAYGDPAIDVAYCRMDMYLSGMSEAAAEFLSAYEAHIGQRVMHLGLWELAAAARPLFNPEGWISESPAKERFSQFIAAAKERAES